MNSYSAPATYKDLKEKNVAEKRYLTVILGNKLLTEPIPLRCMFCGDALNIATHRMPKAIIDVQYEIADCDPQIDVRCKRCRVNWRITY